LRAFGRRILDSPPTFKYVVPVVVFASASFYLQSGRKKEKHVNKIVLSSIVAVAGIAASAQAQVGSHPGGGTSGAYTFEFRLIPDGTAGAPAGPGSVANIGDPAAVTATRIGFWLQARVAQTSGENWGVVRASSPAGGTAASFISVSDPSGASSLSRGSVNAANTNFGRGSGYRNGGTNTANTGNNAGNSPFPGSTGNENGGLDNGGAGALMTRVYAFDSYVGATRNAANPDDPSQPWNVNGALGAGAPVPSDGTFSPWASVYRVWVDVTNFNAVRDITVSASALLNGALQAAPTDPSQGSWAMQIAVNNGVVANASYVFHVVPTPGAAAMLGLGGLAAMRRRR
jgi:hypothetical protein